MLVCLILKMICGVVLWVCKYGIKERNLAGEDFLQFCQCNQLSIMNMHFVSEAIMALGCILLQNPTLRMILSDEI